MSEIGYLLRNNKFPIVVRSVIFGQNKVRIKKITSFDN